MGYFVLGLVAGGVIGMILSALMVACRDYDDRADEEQERWLHEEQKDMPDV